MAKKNVFTIYELICVAYEMYYGIKYDEDKDSDKDDKWNKLIDLGPGFDMCSYELSSCEYHENEVLEELKEDPKCVCNLAILKIMNDKKIKKLLLIHN